MSTAWTVSAASRVEISPLREIDLPAVMEIEGICFGSPWPQQAFEDEFDIEWAYLFAARDDEAGLVGYSDFWIVRDEVHLLNLAVRPEFQRRGIARRLVLHMFDQASRMGGRFVYLEVRRSNLRAQGLYYSLGFEQAGVRKNYYTAEREDALVLSIAI